MEQMSSTKLFLNFSFVLLRRESWNEERKNERIGAIDDMLAELCERNAIRPLALESLPGYQLQMEPFEELDDELGNIFEEEHPYSVSISSTFLPKCDYN
ncbi:unnamed protein product [Cylicostephanus goldi]|uniref:Uncharacterized protein n=1 Tax=Cylicostephanus goldi TaxID=71465 RepID=A0A3P6UPM0_CYLGO|nr:unnamed protein product [Cylicostephanus goldi]